MKKTYLVEYKMIMPSGQVLEGIETTWAQSDSEAQDKVDTWLRIGNRNVDVHIGDAVTV